jgi:PhnB protein
MTQSKMNPYISFKGNAREAMEFYKAAFGGKLTMSTFKEAGMPVEPAEADQIMHAMLEVDNGILLMASDTPHHMGEVKEGARISVSLSGDNEAELSGYWKKLSEGGTVEQPLVKAPWGDTFGMFTDKFGIHWLVNIAAPKA